jgi:hypothetical protein
VRSLASDDAWSDSNDPKATMLFNEINYLGADRLLTTSAA